MHLSYAYHELENWRDLSSTNLLNSKIRVIKRYYVTEVSHPLKLYFK